MTSSLTISSFCCSREVIGTPIKRLEQQDLLVVKLEVISIPITRQEQDLLVVKLEVISTPMKRLEQEDLLIIKLEMMSTPIKRFDHQ
jgi:uncharacterized protein with ParB-like and HNH nuclease domain